MGGPGRAEFRGVGRTFSATRKLQTLTSFYDVESSISCTYADNMNDLTPTSSKSAPVKCTVENSKFIFGWSA